MKKYPIFVVLSLVLLSSLFLSACASPYYSGSAEVVGFVYNLDEWQLRAMSTDGEVFSVRLTDQEYYDNKFTIGETISLRCRTKWTYCQANH